MNPIRIAVLAFPVAVLSLAGCGGDVGGPGEKASSGTTGPATPSDPPPASTDPLATSMLSLHDSARAAATPTPSPALPPLGWSDAAAAAAQAWANGCVYGHDPALGSLHMGQNVFAAGSTAPITATPAQVVGSWVGEAPNYHYDSNTCDTGKVCGHYTQVVWRSTTAVGCGHHTCTTGSPWGAKFPYWDLWVCNYVPPGNYSGQKPY